LICTSFVTTGKGYQQHRCQSFPSSSVFAFNSNDFKDSADSTKNINAFQKAASSDPLFNDDSETPDFGEDLTSEVALFHACEHLIGELEASTFSSRLSNALHYTEKVLVDANNLQSFDHPFPLPRTVPNLPRFSSLQNVTTPQTLHRCHRRVRSLDCHLDSYPDGSSFDDMLVDCPNEVLEPCQTSLVAGGLVRAASKLYLRRGSCSTRIHIFKFFLVDRLGLPKILSFSSLCEPGSLMKSRQINNSSGLDPLLPSRTPPLATTSNQRHLPVGVENFFRNTSTEPKDGTVSGSGDSGLSRLISKPRRVASRSIKLILKEVFSCHMSPNQLWNWLPVCAEYLRSLRFCEYFGRFFCCVCHANTLMAVPGALLHSWSGAMYPVSKFARDLLIRVHNRPLLHSTDFGPAIRRNPPWSLLDACQLRRQAMAIIPFLRLCPDSFDVLAKLDKLPTHWVTCTDRWSLSDLVSLANSSESSLQSISGCLRSALEACVAHLSQCLRCRARGHLCEVCHAGRVLFPHFGQADTLVCSDCGACFHRACFAAMEAVASRESTMTTPLGSCNSDPDRSSCPRCIRLRRRRELSGASLT
uniref:DUF4206 domain-containing protein n=1 Tax=Hydatigena taeniaeformis TaxID=6205 RepID=A0A0R3X4W1_HYDTA